MAEKKDILTLKSFFIPVLRNIGILQYKKAKLPKHLRHSVISGISEQKTMNSRKITNWLLWNQKY